MRGPSLQKTALLSFAFHLTAFLIIFLILRQSNHMVISSPYTVSLVSPDVSRGIERGKIEAVVKETREPSVPSDIPKKRNKETAREKDLIDEKISAIAAKKKIEKLVRLRSIISLKASGDKYDVASKMTSPPTGKSTTFDEYYSKIMKEIRDQWNCPPQICKNDLQAVISIRILKDGTVIAKLENGSGNTLFDRSARRAVDKASPLTPPPYEMEIGVRFHP